MKLAVILVSSAAALALGQTGIEDYQVSGVVVDHLTRRPLNHILVQLVRASKGGGDASAITTEDGRFTFLHVPAGKYQLSAAKRGQAPQQFNQSDGGYATAVVVDGRQKKDGIIFTMRTDAAISGNVMGEDGEPVSGATVQLFRQAVNDGEAETVQQAGSNTNSSGQFHFGHLEAGSYYVSVGGMPWFSQPGLGAELVYPVTFYGDTSDGSAARVVTLPEGGSASLQVNLRSASGIRVKMAEQTNDLQLFVPGPGGSEIPVGLGFSNGPQGNELFNLAAGRYVVHVGGQLLKTVDLANGSTLDLDSGANSSIAGRILFEGGRPGGQVQIFLGNGAGTGVADDGTFNFKHAVAGTYGVSLMAPNRDLTIASVTARGARMVHDKLEVAAGAAVELTIRAVPSESMATLDGFAVHDGVGTPGAMVLLLPLDLAKDQLIRRDQSDADGSFSLARIAPGRYRLVAIDDGRNLAYKTESVIKPYLGEGLAVTIPLTSTTPLQVAIQARKR